MIFLILIAVVLIVWFIRGYLIRTIPRRQYLRAIWEQQLFMKQEWINEILIRYEVSALLKKDVSKWRNSFNLRRLVHEGLIEYKESKMGFSGKIVIPVATFRITDKGLDEYRGSPP